jgi:negative regulator of sigma E activity
MRDEPVLNNDISQSVADAIARLPAEAAKSQGDISQPVKSHWLQDILAGTWLKPALGVAFASSVAVLTIFVNQQQTTNTTVTASAGAATVLADKAAFTPVSIELSHFDRQSVADNDTENKTAVREQLNNYLVSHARSTSGTNYQGMVPYVRVVAYEPAHGK